MSRPVVLLCAALLGCGRLAFDPTSGGDDGDGDGGTLALSPATSTINVGSRVALIASGGVPPYQFAIVGEGHLVDAMFVAPSRAGESTITVTDAAGRTASALVRYRGDRLFVAGGQTGGGASPSVLSSVDGASWTPAGMLPAARANGAFVVFDDRLFYLGGLNTGGSPTNTVFASSDGVTWAQVGTLPIATTGFTSIVHRGELWIIGGATSNGDGVDAYHSTDGATWIQEAPISGPRHEHDLISHGGRLYVLGGHGNGFLEDVQSTVDGTSWSAPALALTFGADFAAAAQLGDRAIRICGAGCTTTEVSDDLITWTPAAALPGQRQGAALVAFDGRLLAIGGALDVLATTDGSAWTTVGSLPEVRTLTGAVQFTPR